MDSIKTRRFGIGILVVIMLVSAVPAGAAVRTWDGGGSDSRWQTSGNWSPDGYSTDDDLIVLSGAPTSSSSKNVVADNGGSITLDGSAAVANFGLALIIARSTNALGWLDILNGADVSNTIGYMGYNDGASGEITVSGAGSRWTNSNSIYAGWYGTGVLSITDSGSVSSSFGNLGYNSGAFGTATVSGVGSRWTNSTELYVGWYGTGALNITAGGAVSNTIGCVGYGSDSSGEVRVNGTGSTWTNSTELYVGRKGAGVLNITDGGAVSNTGSSVGCFSSSSGEVTVSGEGSTWTNGGDLFIGNAGTGTLSITAGGAVSNTTGYLGYSSGASGTATVSGAGSTWTNSSSLIVGLGGTGALTISDGGAVSNAYGYLGESSDSSGTAAVSGAGSTWTNNGWLYVGHYGTGALSITDGGAVSNTVGILGCSSLTSVSTATVSGTGSTWTNNDVLVVGSYGTGVLSITDGGEVSNTYGYLGYEDGSSGTVMVSGVGSMWTNTNELTVGHSGTGTLTITDGGAVNVAATLTIGANSSSDGTVNLEGGSLTAEAIVAGDGAAAFNWTGGTLNITGDDGLRLDSTGLLGATVNIHAGKGLNVADETDVRSGVTLAVTGGTFSTDVLDVAGTAQLRSGTITIGSTFVVDNGGELEISGQDLALMNAPKLDSGAELIFDGTTITMPSLALPSGASIDLDSGKISAAETFANAGVVRMGNTGAATIRANLLTNDGAVMGKGTIQAELSNSGNMGFSGDTFFTEDVQNNTSSLIAISGGAGATFYEDVTNNGELRVGADCTATFYGSLSGNGCSGTGTVYLDGDMRPGASPGEMVFGGDVVFGWGASLEAELAGDGTGQYDSIDVAGDLALAGTLDVVLIDGFNPELNDTFNLLSWGSLDGEFGTVNLPGLDSGLSWDTSELYNDGGITVVPEPATMVLLLSGGVLTMLRRRRKARA